MDIQELEARAEAAYQELLTARRKWGRGSAKVDAYRQTYLGAADALSDAVILAMFPPK